MKDQELEVKFNISDLRALEARLNSLRAELVQPRTYEKNLRFDLPSGELTNTFQVLRLRKDTAARLTYKGPGESREGVRLRKELEFEVSDFDAAQAFLEALGYQVSMYYEKYRTMYDIGEVHVTLDEMPYGDFAEIEGPDPASILKVNQMLGLDWEARTLDSYVLLFDRLRQKLGLPFQDLSFENFRQIHVTPADLDLLPADRKL